MHWGAWRSYLVPPRHRPGDLPPVIGRGVLPDGTRFVVLRTSTPWPTGSSVELLTGDPDDPTPMPGHGWVAGPMGTGLTRVMLGNGCDARLCRWARVVEAG